MKVIMFDPWGTHNMNLYTNGLCESIADFADLTLWTNHHHPNKKTLPYPVKRIFFKRSENMKQGYLRNFIRLCEYYSAYLALIKELKKNKYDIIHIQWLLHYKSDLLFLARIKQHCAKIIYTAHNVLPHRNGKKHYQDLKKIYNLVDIILVHGEEIKKEFIRLFGSLNNKISIQRHGSFEDQDLSYNRALIDVDILDRVKHYKRVSIFFGNIFFNKGVDRLARIWLENYKHDHEKLLIIAGKKDVKYKELEALEAEIAACDNILYLNSFIDTNLLNYLIDQSDIVLLPYRYASMSGVIFTAAAFKKPVLTTKTGAIPEYLLDGENSFLVDNCEKQFAVKLKAIYDDVDKKSLVQMGFRLNKHIREKYSWTKIGQRLAETIYGIPSQR